MEVRQTRHQEIKLIKYDTPFANIRYTGRSSSLRGLDSQPIWQILKEYKICSSGITVSTYANMGEFNCVWDDRATYFSDATVGDDNCPLEGTIAVTGNFSFSPSGLRNGGRHSFVTVDAVSWTPLPATPLTDRNGISIQNFSGIDIKLRYVNTDAAYRGTTISGNGGDRFYDIKDTIILYAKSASGTPEIIVEELS